MAQSILITGVTGQDGAYLAGHCLDLGWQVIGQGLPEATLEGTPLAEMGLSERIEFLPMALDSVPAARALLQRAAPDHVANLAAQSSVPRSFSEPVETAEANAMLPLHLLEAIRQEGGGCRFLQASTAEIFGSHAGFCDETTPLSPVTPYAMAKTFAHQMTILYRATHGLFASNAILFPHESPHRGDAFLTRKVTRAFARIRAGLQDVLELGALSAERDWGFAGDYVAGMALMLSAKAADDFVLATGETHSVREFVELTAACNGYDLQWRGEGLAETGVDRMSGKLLVRINPEFFRHADVPRFLGDPAKAERELGWKRSIDFHQLVALMCEADRARLAT